MRLARTLVVCLIFGTLSPGAFLQEKKSAWDRISSHFAPPEGYRDSAGKYDSLLKFSDGRPVNTAEDWRARRQEILKTWQTLLGAWPPLLENPMLKVLEKESVESFTRYKVEIDIAPGRTTVAYLLVPPRKGPFPAVVDVFYHPRDGAGITKEKRGQNDYGYQLDTWWYDAAKARRIGRR